MLLRSNIEENGNGLYISFPPESNPLSHALVALLCIPSHSVKIPYYTDEDLLLLICLFLFNPHVLHFLHL